MRIVFRLGFHTSPGQSLSLRLATSTAAGGPRIEQGVPMRWINHRQWQAEVEIQADAPLHLEYAYRFHQDGNGVNLDEWNGPRSLTVDPAKQDACFLHDTWCSAGTVDYALETSAFQHFLPARKGFENPVIPKDANHEFRLRMAAVPTGLVPCLIGSVAELGDWNWHAAVPMREIAPNVWHAALYLPQDWWISYKYGLFDVAKGRAVSLESGENRTLEPRPIGTAQWTVVSDEGYRRDSSQLIRGAGVAMPVFSLRGEQSLGVGEFADLKPFADWAAKVGLKLIQILPINDTTSSHSWTDSYPYSAISVFALHPLYLRIDDLGYPMPADFSGEVDAAREWLNTLEHVDYEEVMQAKHAFARRVFELHGRAITASKAFRNFVKENRDWLPAYAAFCVKRDEFGTADFSHWGEWAAFDANRVEQLAKPDHPQWPDFSYHLWLQYELDRQLTDAVNHLHAKGIALKGDLPIGIDRESVDAWSHPHLFKMESQAGAPPDAFAIKGQNWGFPTYNWEVMARDGFAWWRSRFEKLSRYFDAYRIDHILGFFRIWQVPIDQVEGIMGWFDPATPVHIDEIRSRGIPFDQRRHCQPYIREHFLFERFADTVDEVKKHYLDHLGHGVYQLKPGFSTQRGIEEHFATWNLVDPAVKARAERIRWGLFDCVSDVLFLEVPGSHGTLFHPRCSLQMTKSFQELDHDTKWRVEQLYVDYFFRRQEGFWQARGYEKLPAMRRASPMLLCGEDLGMVPDCVPGVMRELGILSLEIQRMPKSSKVRFADPAHAPYLSVVSPSTHDMPTLRGWWREDPHVTGEFAWHALGVPFPPQELTGGIAEKIILQHLHSPAMWAVFPLQDLLAIDESLRHPDPDEERINVPAIMPYYWRYRCHLALAELAAADEFNARLAGLIRNSGRA